MFAVRHVPQRTAPGFYPRCAAVAGTFLSVGMVLLPLQELSSALYLGSLLLIIGGTGLAIYAALVLGRSISILRGSAPRYLGALCPRSLSTVSWRDRCHCWGCAAVLVSMGAVAVGFGMRISTSTHEIRGAGTVPGFSEIWRLHAWTARLMPGVY